MGLHPTTPGRYTITADTDGSGNWQVTLPADCELADLEALAPVVDTVKAFLEPTVGIAVG